MGASISAEIGIPGFGAKFSETINMNFSKTETQSINHIDTWEIDVVVPVPALTYVDANFTVIEEDY